MERKLEVAEFGGLVAGLRRTRGLTQEALADRSGISVRTIRNLEAGRVSRPRPASVSLLANALELNGSQRTTFEMTGWSDGGVIAWSDGGAAASWVVGSGRVPDNDYGADADRVPDNDRAEDPGAFPPGSASSRHGPHPLVESLVGREADIARLLRIVPQTPLVLLTGPGGVGKTRLAVAAAHLMAPGYPDGVRVVQLGALAAESAPDDVARALLLGLGVAVTQHGALATLAHALADRQVLLVVDTAEHVAKAVARVAEHLLLACPHLHMIVTSRRSFSVPSEYVYEVLPLPAPSAVRLFMRRAAEQCPDLDLTDQQDMVTTLCERLDGLPLAIEWAVSWLRSISADVLLERLNPDMLGMPVMTGLPHQQRLTTSVNWSLNLITSQQRRLLACLARFTGYLDLAEVEQLAGNGDLADVDLDAELAALVSNSLVQVIRGRSYRYRLLHLIRDCLTASPLLAGLPSALSGCRRLCRRRRGSPSHAP
jgi:predicted ATPase/DNA-binding XRE family transcriptional regulator